MSSEMAGLSRLPYISLCQERSVAVLPFQGLAAFYRNIHRYLRYSVAVALHTKKCTDKQVDFTGSLDTNYRVATAQNNVQFDVLFSPGVWLKG